MDIYFLTNNSIHDSNSGTNMMNEIPKNDTLKVDPNTGLNNESVVKQNQNPDDTDRVKNNLSTPYECQTCSNRKYVDGSNDPGVSMKTPTKVSPGQAASVVASHEREHVTRERAKASAEGRQVVSQSVTIHTSICAECGKPYVSGGTTKTVTASKKSPNDFIQKVNTPRNGATFDVEV